MREKGLFSSFWTEQSVCRASDARKTLSRARQTVVSDTGQTDDEAGRQGPEGPGRQKVDP